MTRLRTFLRRQRLAWTGLLLGDPPALSLHAPLSAEHPAMLCRCFGEPSGHPALQFADHLPDCLWLAAMCKLCSGLGVCQRCRGDGTDPGGAVDLFEEREALQWTTRYLEDMQMPACARALRTLLERLDGAP